MPAPIFEEGRGFDPGPDEEDDISWDPDRSSPEELDYTGEEE